MASNLADVNSFRQFVGTLHKTGLTPSESNLRTGLTPGGFPFGQLPGLNSPMTPGLLSLLGIDSISQANVPPQAQAQSQNSAQLDQSIQNANAQINQDIQNAQINQAQIQNVQNAQKAQIAQNVLLQNAHINQIQAQQQNVHTNTNKRKSSVGQPKSKSRKIKLEIDEEDEDDMEPSSPEDPLKPPKTEAEKRKNFLERNRVAASKCRQRKKQLLQKMEDELSFYSTGYRELSSHVSQLRDALLSLKELADLHKDLVPPEVLQQCSYVLTLTAGNSGNVTSIPSTIPTTLQSVEAPIQYQPQSTSSNNSYEINNQNLQDLPQSVNENGELRAIHSMSNLANMQQNQQIQQNQLSQQNLQTQSNLQPQMFLMRNANSMVDLQNYQRQFYDGQQPQQQLQVQQLQQVQQNLPGQLIQQPSLQFLNSTKLVT